MEKITTDSRYDRIYELLASIVGSKYVSNEMPERYLYRWDFISATTPPGRCDFVIMPRETVEVQEIVRLANREKIPVVPAVSRVNTTGCATPRQGGIVLDLRRMKEVLEVNEDDMYALVEGGITWGDLSKYLADHHPDLRMGYPYASPGQGVVPCCLEQGFIDTSLFMGSGADHINGVEAVLGNGEIVTTGVAAYTGGRLWYSRYPGPDITGLFIGWSGRMGIVTKAAIKLMPKLPRCDYCVNMHTVKDGIELELKLTKAGGPLLGLIDLADVNFSWAVGDSIRPEDLPFKAEDKGFDDYIGKWCMSAYTEEEMEAKAKVVQDIVKEKGGKISLWEDMVESLPMESRGEAALFMNLPYQGFANWKLYFGGISEWVGSYFSWKAIPEFYNEARELCTRNKKHAFFSHRAMYGGHYNYARVMVEGNKDIPEDVELVKKLCYDMDDISMKHGGVRYKAPWWVYPKALKMMDVNAAELMRSLKKLVDPNDILNPGHGF
jgi:FAD/FMN-containing dehydrogenase